MANYTDLLEKKAALEKQAAELQKQLDAALKVERSGVIAQIRALMAEHGLSAADLEGKPSKGDKSTRAPSTNKGRIVAAKYKDPQSGATWSGRGLKPKWLTAALVGGKTVEDFAI